MINYTKTSELTKIAKNIFGDIVETVYVEHFSKSDNVNKIVEKILKNSKPDELQYDDNTIVIKFTNGRFVNFTGSEWCSITINEIINEKI